MSDPTETNKDNPHPVSSHRTPSEIAKDEAGPIGSKPAEGNPAEPVTPELTKSDKERQAAVKRSAHTPKK
jgi:hypothetical protein